MMINTSFSSAKRIAYTKLLGFNSSRIVLIITVCMGLSIMFANSLSAFFNINYSAYELVIYNSQEILHILFIYVFVLLIISGDFSYKRDKWEYAVMLRSSSLKSWFLGHVIYIFLCSLFLIILQLITDTFAACLFNGVSAAFSNTYNKWVFDFSMMPQGMVAKISPLPLMLIAEGLLLLRYFFWGLVIFFVSSRTKHTYFGGIIVIAISGVEWATYQVLTLLIDIQHSLYILPIEHNMLRRMVISNVATPERIPIIFSYLYWFLLTAVLMLFTWRSIKRSD